MSGFAKLFGFKKDEKAITSGEAIQKLRETEEMLMKKQDFLEKKIETEKATAIKNGTKNKRGGWRRESALSLFYYNCSLSCDSFPFDNFQLPCKP